MATVPDTTNFSLQDVVDVVNPTTDDLVDCFSDADADSFDPRYSESKNQLDDFRNYGIDGTLTFVETETGGWMDGIHGNIYSSGSYFFFVACSDQGIRTYTTTTGGAMTLQSTYDPGTHVWKKIWVENDFVFATSNYSGQAYISSFTCNTSGVLSAVTLNLDNVGTAFTHMALCGDGNKFIFVADDPSLSAGICTYEYDSSGNLSYKTRYDIGANYYYDLWYVDGYLFAVGSEGVTSYSVNQTSGALTQEDIDDNGWTTENFFSIYSDGSYLYVGTATQGMTLWTWDSNGDLTFKDDDDVPARSCNTVWVTVQGLIIAVNSTYADTWKKLATDYLTNRDSTAITGCFEVYQNEDAPNVVMITRGSTGISSYLLS